jgi:hypothetical protein
MAKDTRIVKIDADQDLGQFMAESIEQLFESPGGEETDEVNVNVEELDPNNVPDRFYE